MAQFIGKCILISFCVVLFGCKTKKEEPQKKIDYKKVEIDTNSYNDNEQMHPDMPNEKPEKAVCSLVPLIKNAEYKATPSDAFELMRYTIKNDTLKLFLKYGGGCKATQLAIHWNQIIAESYPAQVNVKPVFVDNDPCRALIQQPFCFALKQLNLKPPYYLILDLPENKTKKILIK